MFLKSLDAAQQKYPALKKNIVFKKQIFGKTIVSKKDCYVFVYFCHFHSKTIVFQKNLNVNLPTLMEQLEQVS